MGEDTPILTRLAQWKIVPKRAVDLGFDLQDASAPSRSSVNNCTGGLRSEDSNPPGSFEKIDLDGMSRRERRQLKLRRSDKVETACDNVIAKVKDLCGETISRGLAVRLIKGTQTKIAGQVFRSLPNGELARPILEPKQTFVLERFNRLVEKNRKKRP